jgi:hypothetical protein
VRRDDARRSEDVARVSSGRQTARLEQKAHPAVRPSDIGNARDNAGDRHLVARFHLLVACEPAGCERLVAIVQLIRVLLRHRRRIIHKERLVVHSCGGFIQLGETMDVRLHRELEAGGGDAAAELDQVHRQ